MWTVPAKDAKGVMAMSDAPSATALMLAQPSVIKRPVVVWSDGRISVGFTADAFATRLGHT